MTTAGAILDGAFNRSAANDVGKLAQSPELLAHLSRCYQRLWALVARARPDQFASSRTLALHGVPPTAALPADLIDVLHIATPAGAAVTLAPIGERLRSWHLAPCVYRQGLTLVSRNQAGDPRTGATLTVALLDAPAALTTRAAVLDARWPARHVQLLVDVIAVYLSVKDAGRAPGEHAKLVADAQMNAAAFASEFGLAPEAVEWVHAPTERATGAEA